MSILPTKEKIDEIYAIVKDFVTSTKDPKSFVNELIFRKCLGIEPDSGRALALMKKLGERESLTPEEFVLVFTYFKCLIRVLTNNNNASGLGHYLKEHSLWILTECVEKREDPRAEEFFGRKIEASHTVIDNIEYTEECIRYREYFRSLK